MMSIAERTVGDLVTEQPARARIFERFGIDFCCGGKTPLAEACASRGIATESVVQELDRLTVLGQPTANAPQSLPELIEDIIMTHHAPLKTELPGLARMAVRVASVHGDRDSRLLRLAETVTALWDELTTHMLTEEEVVFPAIRALVEPTSTEFAAQPGLVYLIESLEGDHAGSGDALSQIRAITDEFTPPSWACHTYQVLLDGLRDLERDLHTHVHKENNILFPRALELATR